MQQTTCPIEQLRQLIIQKDYNQRELQHLTKLSKTALSNFITGTTSSSRVFSKLCQALNITLTTSETPSALPRKRPGRPRKEL